MPCWSCREKPGSGGKTFRLQHVARLAGVWIIPHYTHVFEACSYFGRLHALQKRVAFDFLACITSLGWGCTWTMSFNWLHPQQCSSPSMASQIFLKCTSCQALQTKARNGVDRQLGHQLPAMYRTSSHQAVLGQEDCPCLVSQIHKTTSSSFDQSRAGCQCCTWPLAYLTACAS